MKSKVGGINVDVLTTKEWSSLFYRDVLSGFSSGRAKFFTSINGNALSLSARDAKLRRIICNADGVDPDGMSIVLASRFLPGPSLPERVVTTDFAHEIFSNAKDTPISVYLLGGTNKENAKAREAIKSQYNGVTVHGRDGYFDENEEPNIIKEINDLRPDILFVGMGVPKEQYFCDSNLNKLNAGWIKTCGGMFKVFGGDVQRPPIWVQNIGMEWFYRCLKEPRHVLLRYLITNPHSIYLILKNRNK